MPMHAMIKAAKLAGGKGTKNNTSVATAKLYSLVFGRWNTPVLTNSMMLQIKSHKLTAPHAKPPTASSPTASGATVTEFDAWL